MDQFPEFKRGARLAAMGGLVILAVVVACVVLAMSSFVAGEEFTLFPACPAAGDSDRTMAKGPHDDVSLFPDCSMLSLFAPPIEHDPERDVMADSVDLFDGAEKTPLIEHVDVVSLLDLFALADTRPYMVVYCPTWCILYPPMADKIGIGDSRIRIRVIKGEESDFPDFVRDYVCSSKSYGYPVLHWTSPTGKFVLFHGVKTLDELVELAHCEPGELPPAKSKTSVTFPPSLIGTITTLRKR